VGVLMLFIWLDGAPLLHRAGGSLYLVWLLVAGAWLIIRGVRPAQLR
jgi:hypothetical protein